jgi:hypothetical protein
MKTLGVLLSLLMLGAGALGAQEVNVSSESATSAPERVEVSSSPFMRPIVLRDDLEIQSAAGNINNDTLAVSGNIDDTSANVSRPRKRLLGQ